MSGERCALSWKAAALEDGRLEGADRASFELHATACSDCRAEKKALASLYARMRAQPVSGLAPLARARQRSALLARANERFVGPPSRGGHARWSLAALVVIAVGGLAVALARRETHPGPVAVVAEPTMPPRYEVSDGAHAIWRARSDGGSARVDLADGVASFHVDPLAPRQRFVVALPDGELEATGARFTVDVALGRTSMVSVAEGGVVLHQSDARDIVLHAGEGWTRADAIAAAIVEGRTPLPSTRPPGPAASASSSSSAHGAEPGHRESRTARHPPPPASTASSRIAGAKFDEAVSSFVNGSYARADTQLSEFAREFPEDARCEDASFLGAVSRWRLHDGAGARSRAEAYLKAYPNGLRRSEAQHIADDAR